MLVRTVARPKGCATTGRDQFDAIRAMNHVVLILRVLLAWMVTCDNARTIAVEAKHPETSIRVSLVGTGYATIVNDRHPNQRLGYRFHEHSPLAYGLVPTSDADAGIRAEDVSRLEANFRGTPGVVVFQHNQLSDADWTQQDWTYFLRPVSNGVELLWIVATHDAGLPEFYGVQQCFRLSGSTNAEWRQKIARTPEFSEYDLWAKQGDTANRTSLTYVLRNGAWQALPAGDSAVGARTPLGIKVDRRRSADRLMERVGPYQAEMLEPVDDGPFVRNNLSQTWATGIYWQGTSHVTVHHPADCLHTIVNIGQIPAQSRRAIRGKIYWLAGDKHDLKEHFRNDAYLSKPPEVR